MSLAWLLVMVAAFGAAPVYAQGGEQPVKRAGIVVVQGDGSAESRCVGFSEESINGYELLVRGGFVVRSEVTSMGVSVCSVDGQGCGDGQDCFCQCLSSPCIYWTYWQRLPEGWRYAGTGSAVTQVNDGDIQAWVWGESKTNAASENEPPALAFTDICTADATIYGIEPASDSTTDGLLGQSWMVAMVVAVPLLLAAAWWLQQRRKVA